MKGVGDSYEGEGIVKVLADDTVTEGVRRAGQGGSSEGRKNKTSNCARKLHYRIVPGREGGSWENSNGFIIIIYTLRQASTM